MMHFVRRVMNRLTSRIESLRLPTLRPEFRHLPFSAHAMQKLLDDYDFKSVLDVGCGSGEHAECFLRHGKQVTAVDYGQSVYFEQNRGRIDTIIGDFNEINFDQTYDCLWCSHVLEHQLNPNRFLTKVHRILREGGVLAITVPPLKHEIVGGHVTVWNAGLLMYNLVLAGFDCRLAGILKYGYNISLLVNKTTAHPPADLAFDRGDIRKLRRFLPSTLAFSHNEVDDPFDGWITRLNW